MSLNINCTVNSSTQHAPYTIVYGQIPPTPLDLELNPDADFSIASVDQLRREARQNLLLAQNAYASKYNLNRKLNHDLLPYSFVMLERHTTTPGYSAKLQSKFIGPYQIIQKLDDLHYECIDTRTKNKQPIRVHVDRIKKIGDNIFSKVTPPTLPQQQPSAAPKKRGRPRKIPVQPAVISSPTQPGPEDNIQHPRYTTRAGRSTKPPTRYGQ